MKIILLNCCFFLFYSCNNQPAHWDDSPPKQKETVAPCGNAQSMNTYQSELIFGYPVDLEKGRKLFRANCSACHQFSSDLTGPALEGVLGRVPDASPGFIKALFMKQDSLIKNKNSYYLNLKKRFNSASPQFTFLTDQDASDIVAYILRCKNCR